MEKLAGSLGNELIRVTGTIANRQNQLKQYAAAEASYQNILKLVDQLEQIEEKERNGLKGGAFHQLGIVAQKQRQWAQAEQYYQQALQIFIEYNDRYAQASTYHNLGIVAQEQRQWEQAEAYYQQALQIYVEYNDRYKQASTYHQLGRVAEEQRQWEQAREYFLHALEIFVEYKDTYSGGVVLRSLARLWKASGDANLSAATATILGYSVEETEKLLREMLEEE